MYIWGSTGIYEGLLGLRATGSTWKKLIDGPTGTFYQHYGGTEY